MYVLSFSCFCFLGSPPQIKLIQYALVLHFIENMSQLSQVEQNKDYQEISEAAASCEEPSGKWNSDSSHRQPTSVRDGVGAELRGADLGSMLLPGPWTELEYMRGVCLVPSHLSFFSSSASWGSPPTHKAP